MKTITKNGVEIPLQQNFYYYQSASTPGARFSGAYIFRPDGSGIYTNSTKAEVTVYKGKCKTGAMFSKYLILTFILKCILYNLLKQEDKRVCRNIYVIGNNFFLD